MDTSYRMTLTANITKELRDITKKEAAMYVSLTFPDKYSYFCVKEIEVVEGRGLCILSEGCIKNTHPEYDHNPFDHRFYVSLTTFTPSQMVYLLEQGFDVGLRGDIVSFESK